MIGSRFRPCIIAGASEVCRRTLENGSTHSITLLGVLLYRWVRSGLSRLALLLIRSSSCRETNLKRKHPRKPRCLHPHHLDGEWFIYFMGHGWVGVEGGFFWQRFFSNRQWYFLTTHRWVDEVSFILIRTSIFANTIFIPAKFFVEGSWSHSPNMTRYWH